MNLSAAFSWSIVKRFAAWLPCVWVATLAPAALAHPLSQGSLDVVIYADRVSVRARVTVEEMTVTNRATTPDPVPGPFAVMDSASYEQHAAYLASHLRMIADGVRLSGGVARVEQPDAADPKATDMATYELLYPLPPKMSAARQLDLHCDVLTEAGIAPTLGWEATYVVRMAQDGRPPVEGLLLTPSRPLRFACDWTPAGTSSAAASSSNSTRWRILKDYFFHGIHHIFSIRDPGYDHLLFVSALVLGATTLWELFKLVTAFTLAHTITLTLAALNLVHVSERVVEPLIALSIVFVAVENVLFPRRSHGWLRLGVAFFFGLFHGLGFAGGLLQAMQGMNGSVVLIAILAFSIGVETAHQMVVLPLFAALKLARRTRSDEIGRQHLSLITQRFGSAAISLAGMFYLVVALRLSFTGGAAP
jgi:hypothetical protein